MKKFLRILLIAAFCVGALAVLALVWADMRFELVRSAPHIPHESEVDVDTGLRAVLYPDRIPAGFYDAVFGGAAWMAQLVPWVAPHELALLSHTDTERDEINLQLVINNRRLGPVIRQAVNEEMELPATALYSWSDDGMQRLRRGWLQLDGQFHADPEVMINRDTRWAGVRPRLHLPLDGGHMFELLLDNRQGTAYALAGTYAKSQHLGEDTLVNVALDALRDVHYLHATANFLSDTDVGLEIRVECDPQGNENTPQAMLFFFEMLLGELRTMLETQYGVGLTGEAEAEGSTVRGRYRLSDFHHFFVQPTVGQTGLAGQTSGGDEDRTG